MIHFSVSNALARIAHTHDYQPYLLNALICSETPHPETSKEHMTDASHYTAPLNTDTSNSTVIIKSAPHRQRQPLTDRKILPFQRIILLIKKYFLDGSHC